MSKVHYTGKMFNTLFVTKTICMKTFGTLTGYAQKVTLKRSDVDCKKCLSKLKKEKTK